jgi:integrase
MAFRVTKTRHGTLAIRGDIDGEQYWEGTGEKDTPDNRVQYEKKCLVMNFEVEHGTFDYSKWFPEGNRATRSEHAKTSNSVSLEAFYLDWVEDKKPPLVRKSQARDYRQHFKAYILPKLGKEVTPVESLQYKHLVKFRTWMIDELELKVKTCRNVIDGSLRAMYRSVWAGGAPANNPFEVLEWPDRLVPPPDPFTEEERDRILEKFRKSYPRLYEPMYFLFWTGARPSEAAALRLGDVDLTSGTFTIRRSRHLGEENAPKTPGSTRTKELLPNLLDVLTAMPARLHGSDEEYFFTNSKGGPIDPNEIRKRYWYGVLSALKIRPRKFYCTKHTFITAMLSAGCSGKFVADYCGTSLEMIEKDYAKYIRHDGMAPMIARLKAATKISKKGTRRR